MSGLESSKTTTCTTTIFELKTIKLPYSNFLVTNSNTVASSYLVELFNIFVRRSVTTLRSYLQMRNTNWKGLNLKPGIEALGYKKWVIFYL